MEGFKRLLKAGLTSVIHPALPWSSLAAPIKAAAYQHVSTNAKMSLIRVRHSLYGYFSFMVCSQLIFVELWDARCIQFCFGHASSAQSAVTAYADDHVSTDAENFTRH